MARELISLREHDPGKDEYRPETAFTVDELRVLEKSFRNKIDIRTNYDNSAYFISTSQYVGYIALPNHVIQIKPKIGNAAILSMLRYSNEELELNDEDVSFQKSEFLHEILIWILLKKVERLIQHGMYRSYKEEEDNLQFVRGRIMFAADIRKNLILKHRTFCQYTDLTHDVLENQIIKYTLGRLVLNIPVENPLGRQLLLTYRLFDHISDPVAFNHDVFSRVSYTRLNEDYRPIHKLCKLLLNNTSIEVNALGAYDAFSFLIDMNKLFEDFVREFLRERFPLYFINKGLHYLDESKEIRLEPDILVKKEQHLSLSQIQNTRF